MASKNLQNVIELLKCLQDEDGFDTACAVPPDINLESHAPMEVGHVDQNTAVNTNLTPSISKTYNVVYGKPSSRKHKTWDLDGILKVENNMATLLDSDGLKIGESKLDNADLVCGEEKYIAGKCVQIVEELTDHESVTKETPAPAVVSVIPSNKAPSTLRSSKLSRQYILSKKCLLRPPSAPATSAHPTNAARALPVSSRKRPLEESAEEAIQSNQPSSNADRRIFTVVYGKPSSKKHKSWEQDGTLEVTTSTPGGVAAALLKDAHGKVVETKSKVTDLDKYESGFETHVGGKCVQILEETTGSSSEHGAHINTPASADESHTATGLVNTLTSTSDKHNEHQLPWRPAKKHRPSLHLLRDENPLTLPKPNVDHQWKHNPSGRPPVDVRVEPFLSRVLKPHQRDGVCFLYRRVCDLALWDLEGAILADEMGLGKTLQCIALVWTLLRQGPYGVPAIRKVLIVTPSSLTSNWKDEFKKWLGLSRMCPFLVDKKNKAEDYVYSSVSPVLIISYDMLTNARAYEHIVKTEFDLLICDEAHRLKNGKSKVYEMMASLSISRRVLLSGTPLQNDLQEFFYLNDFANPGVLGSLREFKKNFETPILGSRDPACTDSQRALGELQSSRLANRTQPFILRRTSDVQVASLNTKRETILVCRATQLQAALYKSSVEYWDARAGKVSHLSMTHALRKICNHPGLLQTEDEEDETLEEDGLRSVLSREWSSLSDGVVSTDQSGKMMLVEALLRDLQAKATEKIVIVSYFTMTLDLFEVLCKQMNYSYLRLDGSTTVQTRQPIVDQFNDPKSPYFVLLLSAKAGGAGLNLIGASRLILYDSDWNPATDMQAMARIWRHGQKKPVHIYRLLTAGTVEEKIFQRQISKVDLTDSVMDVDVSNDTTAKMSPEELKDLFTFEPRTASFIHTSLRCPCRGQGEVTAEADSTGTEEEDEEPFLECFRKKRKDAGAKRSQIRQHMLMSWAHYRTQDEEVLEMVGLPLDVPMISYMFTRSTTSV